MYCTARPAYRSWNCRYSGKDGSCSCQGRLSRVRLQWNGSTRRQSQHSHSLTQPATVWPSHSLTQPQYDTAIVWHRHSLTQPQSDTAIVWHSHSMTQPQPEPSHNLNPTQPQSEPNPWQPQSEPTHSLTQPVWTQPQSEPNSTVST